MGGKKREGCYLKCAPLSSHQCVNYRPAFDSIPTAQHPDTQRSIARVDNQETRTVGKMVSALRLCVVTVFLVTLGVASVNATSSNLGSKSLSKNSMLKHSISVVNALQAEKDEQDGDQPSVGALEQVLHMLVGMKKTLRKEQEDDEEVNLVRAKRCLKKRLEHQKSIYVATNELGSLIDDSKYVTLVHQIHKAIKTAMARYHSADGKAKQIAPLVNQLHLKLKNLQVQILQRESKHSSIQGHLKSFHKRINMGTNTVVPSETEVKEVNHITAFIEGLPANKEIEGETSGWKSSVRKLISKFSSEFKQEESHHLSDMKESLRKLNATYMVPLNKLHSFERTMRISLNAVDHASKAMKFITERHDKTKSRRAQLENDIQEAADELKILMSACNGKKVEFEQRHKNRNDELETMGDLVQFLHQQLVVQQQKLSDSVELLKAGSLN